MPLVWAVVELLLPRRMPQTLPSCERRTPHIGALIITYTILGGSLLL